MENSLLPVSKVTLRILSAYLVSKNFVDQKLQIFSNVAQILADETHKRFVD